MGAIVFCVAFVTTMICGTVFLTKTISEYLYDKAKRIDTAMQILRKTDLCPLNEKDYELLGRLIK